MWSDRPSAACLAGMAAELSKLWRAPGGEAAAVEAVKASPVHLAAWLRRRPGFVWLDGGRAGGRFFCDPAVCLTVKDGRARVVSARGTVTFPARGFDLLEAALACWQGSGAVLAGYFGYELGPELEGVRTPAMSSTVPDLYLGLYVSGLAYGPQGWHAWSVPGGPPAEELARAAELLPPGEDFESGHALSPGPLRSHPDGDEYRAAVERTVARIHQGELFQTNLCRCLEAPLEEELAWPLYLRMRSITPAAHGAFLRLPAGGAVASVSPELFLRVRGRSVESRPIKGTRPRGATPEADRQLAGELEASEKDRAELAMIVDVMRNDLARVCRAGTVAVPEHARLITLPAVHHTVSTVTGRLRPSATAADLLRACFPPASISGAPKIRAMEVAAEEETRRRGPSMGAIGWISTQGGLELSVAIRTAVAANGTVCYHAGAGITAGSDPAQELEETRHKAGAFVRALGLNLQQPW